MRLRGKQGVKGPANGEEIAWEGDWAQRERSAEGAVAPEPVGEAQPAADAATAEPDAPQPSRRREGSRTTMIPARGTRLVLESILVRLVATGGIIGIGVAISAIMVSQDVQGWIVGLVVSIVTVILAAILWSSRQV